MKDTKIIALIRRAYDRGRKRGRTDHHLTSDQYRGLYADLLVNLRDACGLPEDAGAGEIVRFVVGFGQARRFNDHDAKQASGPCAHRPQCLDCSSLDLRNSALESDVARLTQEGDQARAELQECRRELEEIREDRDALRLENERLTLAEADARLGRLVRAMPTFSSLLHHTECSWQYDRDKQFPGAFTTPEAALLAAGITHPAADDLDAVARRAVAGEERTQ